MTDNYKTPPELQYILDMLHQAQQRNEAIICWPDGTTSLLKDLKKDMISGTGGKSIKFTARADKTAKMIASVPTEPLFMAGSWTLFGKSGKIIKDKAQSKLIKSMRERGELIWSYLFSTGECGEPDVIKKFSYSNIGLWEYEDGDCFFVDMKSHFLVEYIHDGVAWFDSVIAEDSNADRPVKPVFRETTVPATSPKFYTQTKQVKPSRVISDDAREMFKSLRERGAFVTSNGLDEALKSANTKILTGFVHRPTKTVVLWPEIVEKNYKAWEYNEKPQQGADWVLCYFMGSVIQEVTF